MVADAPWPLRPQRAHRDRHASDPVDTVYLSLCGGGRVVRRPEAGRSWMAAALA
jgi:hypothetical protein